MIIGLAGGVGGAKMIHGLNLAERPETVVAIVNTADDFELYALRICPDLDTVLYTLGGLANPVTGWGIAGDTHNVLSAMARFGEEPWFQLGDQDFATHILRSERLRAGEPLSRIMADLAAGLGVQSTLLPMTDDMVATVIETPVGDLAFQDYFVRSRQQDEVTGVRFQGIEASQPAPGLIHAVGAADLIVICPSNPIVSIGPILAVPGIRAAIELAGAPKIAVSPIIGGRALKGPADRMLASLGFESSALGVARLYEGLIDGFVIDAQDADEADAIEALGIKALVTDAIMREIADRQRLAEEIIAFGHSLQRNRMVTA